MIEDLSEIEKIVPRKDFILTWWTSLFIWMRRDELISLAARCKAVKVYQGTLIMQVGDKNVKAKISL